MSFSSQKNNNFSFVNINTEHVHLNDDLRNTTPYFCRISRYVNERIKKLRSYRTFLVALKPAQTILHLFESTGEENFFVKIHIPQTHSLNRTNFTLTLEDLHHRISKMKIRFPLCVYCSGNNPTARLNYQQAMEGLIDGRDYLSLLFVARCELKDYKRRWPNQILVELPINEIPLNWKDVYRQSIKVFSETLGVNYTFMLEDNIYCPLMQTDDKFAPASFFSYLNMLQEASSSESTLIGTRVANLGNSPTLSNKEWENNGVQSCFLVRTKDNEIYFSVSQGDDQGLKQFNKDSNSGTTLVQQNQKYVLLCGYTIDDPHFEGDKRQPIFSTLDEIEPEKYGYNLKVKVTSREKVVDKNLSDGSRYARALVVINDATASCVFIANNEQIEQLVPGQCYVLRNTKVVMYKGWMRLEIDEWGKIDPIDLDIPPAPSKNMSTVEYELVKSDESEGE